MKPLVFFVSFMILIFAGFLVSFQLAKKSDSPLILKRLCLTDPQCLLVEEHGEDCCMHYQSYNIYSSHIDSRGSDCTERSIKGETKCPQGPAYNFNPYNAKCKLFQCKVYFNTIPVN